MKVKIIDFGYKHLPNRVHENDAGADVPKNGGKKHGKDDISICK